MAEYQHFDGATYITFYIVFATDNEIQIAVTNRGRISVLTYDLYIANGILKIGFLQIALIKILFAPASILLLNSRHDETSTVLAYPPKKSIA